MNQSHPDVEIYLADNNSENNEGKILAEKFKSVDNIIFIQFNQNHGFTKAHNLIYDQYIAGANYKYLLLLNNDAFAEHRWIENIIQTADRDCASIVSSKMINFFSPDKMDNAGHMLLNTGEILPIGKDESIDKFNTIFENFGACGGACLYKVSMLKEIGFFDSYFNNGYEDVELGMRAKLFGHKCLYEPSAIVHHKMSQSINRIKDQKYIEYIQTSIFYSYLKNMPLLILLLNLPLIVVKYTLVLLFNLFFLRFNFIKSLLNSIVNILREIGFIYRKRKKLFGLNPKYQSLDLIKSMHFFLGVDLKRAAHVFQSKYNTSFLFLIIFYTRLRKLLASFLP